MKIRVTVSASGSVVLDVPDKLARSALREAKLGPVDIDQSVLSLRAMDILGELDAVEIEEVEIVREKGP